jgi:hypothetical protein
LGSSSTLNQLHPFDFNNVLIPFLILCYLYQISKISFIGALDKKHTSLFGQRKMNFYEDKAVYSSEGISSQMNWNYFRKWLETKHYIILLDKSGVSWILPKKAMVNPEGMEKLLTLLNKKMAVDGGVITGAGIFGVVGAIIFSTGVLKIGSTLIMGSENGVDVPPPPLGVVIGAKAK